MGETPAPDAQAPEAPEEKGESQYPTALVNSDMCPGMKVGDTMQVRIVAVHDGQYELAYEEEPSAETTEAAPEAGAAPASAPPEYGG